MATGSVRSLVHSIGTASKAVDITSVGTQAKCKGIYIGNILGTWYFTVGGTVVKFQGTEPGTVLPIKATTASTDAGVTTPPTTGQIIFLY
tara:strand:+ start:866 stop:1135 length:270 start_codon:yes stop_codon:yes gene_type:complete